ncbi:MULTISPECIES: class I adenylate-forming enzyme family protein [Rhodococcus]|jgi:fatty-acyl-CoA synthase/long-chain acyl-CoA synthetase|uniref:Class I adenylate-forming enzyme family protein n=1 Tax=Rhodococcus oxybenzonivorans TaxID=1990687 RepID=A0AAE5A9T7_9NOCA|nr:MULTISPECIES: class I adenylate-forming enzyme family protein [Rhodococcus]MDV7245124.1 class I adenylate-forming enzyme family protein [Rhodococcus oxybenzonivorans]MDV7268478.1 class I adenylate-forming enzyme family protein [Rhodococcus oxybenzonivorans]MDV7272593.1 class I adenylate-forming enzyme family protein [Rhodococcus oxybenzonivorans]MDV7336149.1 class I adenylate-forming enzyme family protein [Rhodococcus oxybenzonivorans]MDV7342835.1 class I adenylate-forming enzyme family pro
MVDNGDWCEVLPVADLLVRGARSHPDRDLIVFPDSRYTYADVLERATHVARGLIALGVRRGDHVGLLAPNGIEFIEGFFGAALIGGVIVPLNARHKATELGYIVRNADLAAVLTVSGDDAYVDFVDVMHDALPSLAEAATDRDLHLPEAPLLRQAVLLRGESNNRGFVGRSTLDGLAETVPPSDVDQIRRRVRIRDAAAILYTSGTTANPKGCILTHEALTRGPVERAGKRLVTDDRHISWAGGPLFHIAALSPLIGAMGAGGTYVTDVYFEPGRALALMKRERPTTVWPWFPAMMQSLMDHPSFDASVLDSLRYLFLIGPRVLIEQVQQTFPSAELVAACGMTETAGIYALSERSDTIADRSGTQGKAAPGIELRIVDPDTGAEQPQGTPGEMLVRGYCVTEGYYKDPIKTAAAIDTDGWFHTGDLYSRTETDCLVFHGRLKDMLKVGGENVAAIEVEAFLCEHPAVKTAAVIGRPDERLDEVPVAFIEIRAGHNVEPDELIEFCQGRIARYKVPRAVHLVQPDDWPMSATKINKRALAERLTEIETGVGAL